MRPSVRSLPRRNENFVAFVCLYTVLSESEAYLEGMKTCSPAPNLEILAYVRSLPRRNENKSELFLNLQLYYSPKPTSKE